MINLGDLLTIFRREIKAYFDSAIAYIFIVVFVLLANGLAASPLMQGVLRFYPEAAQTDNVGRLRTVTQSFLIQYTLATSVICLGGFLL